MTVITDVNTDFTILGLENWIAQIARFEEEFFVKTRSLRNVVFAILAQNRSVGINHNSCIVEDTRLLSFIDWNDDDHAVFFGEFLHQISCRIWNRLS